MPYRISGKESIETFLRICEHEFNNSACSEREFAKMFELMSKFSEPQIVEAYHRMLLESELEPKEEL